MYKTVMVPEHWAVFAAECDLIVAQLANVSPPKLNDIIRSTNALREEFSDDSPLRDDPLGIARLVPLGDVYYKLSALIPKWHPETATPRELVLSIFVVNILQAMENRLRFLRCTTTEAQLRLIIDRTQKGVLTINADGTCAYRSAEAERLLGKIHHVDDPPATRLRSELRRAFVEFLERTYDFGATLLPLRLVDEKPTVAVSSLVVRDPKDPPVLYIFLETPTDIVALVETAVRVFQLTEQQQRVAMGLIQGLTNPQIAEELTISKETVKTHVAALFQKTGARNRTDLLRRILTITPPHP